MIKPDEKARLQTERLKQYELQMFVLEMDIVALLAVGQPADKAIRALDDLKKAHAAVSKIELR